MYKLYFLVSVIVFLDVAIHGVQGGAMVTGTVFCDQCKDGQVSLFDYPLSGMKVGMVCPGSDGQMTVVGGDTTNMLGNYNIHFDGTPDLGSCYAQITANTNDGPGSTCGAVIGPAKSVRLMFSMFDMEMYSVDPLIAQPAQPMSYCPKSSSQPSPSPVTTIPPTPPIVSQPPPVPVVGPVTPVTPSPPPRTPTPRFHLPPLPPLPPMPPMPFVEASACSYQYWLRPEFKCYWRAVSPELTVGLVFGPVAAKKYGTDMTLWSGLQGRNDPYKTLLREAITALLNSYNSFNFPYNAIQVRHRFNTALTGSTRTVLLTALRFKRANFGHGQADSCKFTPCK